MGLGISTVEASAEQILHELVTLCSNQESYEKDGRNPTDINLFFDYILFEIISRHTTQSRHLVSIIFMAAFSTRKPLKLYAVLVKRIIMYFRARSRPHSNVRDVRARIWKKISISRQMKIQLKHLRRPNERPVEDR